MSPSQWLKKTGNTFICIFRVAYMSSKRTWLLAKVYCQFEAKFRTLMIEEILSAAKFRFEAKIQRKSALCSNEMSLKRPRTFDRIFARTFDERSLEQITKFAEFRLHYFCTILYLLQALWSMERTCVTAGHIGPNKFPIYCAIIFNWSCNSFHYCAIFWFATR